MKQRAFRALAALVLAAAAGGAGYAAGGTDIRSAGADGIVTTPRAGTTRVLYSLDAKRNDEELIALIEEAEERAYFAVYVFTLPEVADALVRAKERGVEVRGIVDSEQSRTSSMAPIIRTLAGAGIPVVTERHADGSGIMHLKLLVTEQAYAVGSYNWTKAATEKNDEVLEIGTDPGLRQAYEELLRRLFETYRGNAAAEAAAGIVGGPYGIAEAPLHIGERAIVRGALRKAYESKGGTVFLDFCEDYRSCPFTAVIFADDAKRFGDVSRFVGETVSLTGKIVAYEGRAEIVLESASQLSK